MSARWEDALEAAADVKRFWQSRYGHQFVKGFAQDMFDKGRDGANVAMSMPDIVPEALRHSDTMYVSEEMMSLLEVAKEDFQPEPLIPADLITEFGFALLPRPLDIIDHRGKRTCYRAFSWMPCRSPDDKIGTLVVIYSHLDDIDDYNTAEFSASKEARQGGYLWSMMHFTAVWFNEMPKPYDEEELLDIIASNPDLTEDERETARMSRRTLHRDVVAFFRLTQQTISSRERRVPDRHARRRAMRQEIEPTVTVITLRRLRSRETGEEGTVHWSCRWIVRGHWRAQPYPSLGEGVKRQIWISPYVKGPEDQELRVPTHGRVFEVVR